MICFAAHMIVSVFVLVRILIKTLLLVKASQMLISFSAYTNTKEVFNLNRNKRLAYFSGMKGLSCLGIIAVHSVLSRLWFPVRDPREVESFLASPMASTVNGFFFNVDTFLLISGLLISRTIFRELDR